MKIIEIRRSLEPCTEAGWQAWDLITESPLSDADITGLRVLDGSFLYLRTLKKPFFKIESHEYVIKGVKEASCFRAAGPDPGLPEKIVKKIST